MKQEDHDGPVSLTQEPDYLDLKYVVFALIYNHRETFVNLLEGQSLFSDYHLNRLGGAWSINDQQEGLRSLVFSSEES